MSFTKKELENSFVFDLKTEERTWYLVAESEEDMNRWVSSICLLCGFNPTEDGKQSVPHTFLILALSQREQKWEGWTDKLMSSDMCVRVTQVVLGVVILVHLPS